ncbi:MAG: arsenate reductase (azurin) small subunit [Actinobacteria bacterium]|nr:arsenate reductase (azurin) small subunit [Actinomycetota bacterium]
MTLNRRDFLLGGGVLGALAASGVIVPMAFVLSDNNDGGGNATGATGAAFIDFPRTKVGSLSSLSQTQPAFFDYPFEGQSNVLVKLGQTNPTGVGSDRDVVAYSNLCTHMGCAVIEYNDDSKTLGPCPCHFSTFDLAIAGQVAFGQATQNLPQVHLVVDGDDIFADGVFRLVYGHTNTLDGGTEVAIAGGI